MDNEHQTNTRGRRRSCCGVWTLVLIGLLPILLYGFLTVVGGILIVGDPLRKSDVIVLLGGGDQQRVDEAVKLYMDRFVRCWL